MRLRRTECEYYEIRGLTGPRCLGGGSPPPQQTTSTVQYTYSPAEEAARRKLFSEGERIYTANQGRMPAGYPGAAPVGFSAENIQAQEHLKNAAMGPGAALANKSAQALNFGLGDVLHPDSNPALQASIQGAQRRVGEAFSAPQGPMAGLRQNFMTGNSGGSGTREGIGAGLAARSYLNTIGDINSNMSSAGYGQGLDMMKSSMAFAPNMYNLMMQPGMTMAAVGTQKEGQLAAEAEYGAQQRTWEFDAPWRALSPYASLVTGLSNPSTTTTGTGPAAQANRMAPLGMAMQGAAMGTAIMPGWGTAIGAGAGLLMGMMSK